MPPFQKTTEIEARIQAVSALSRAQGYADAAIEMLCAGVSLDRVRNALMKAVSLIDNGKGWIMAYEADKEAK